jgi:taurine transport system substrate-binding protein
MKAMLAKNGVALESVELLNMQPPQAVAALLNHDVDAAYIWAPFTQDVFSRGGQVLFTSADTPGGGWSYLGFATNSDWSRTHKEALVRFMKALDEAFPLMQQDPQAMLNQAVQTTGMQMETAQFIYKVEKHYPLSDNLKPNTPISLCGLDQEKFGLGRVLKESQDFYLQKGVISQPGNIPGFVDGSFLKAYLKEGC